MVALSRQGRGRNMIRVILAGLLAASTVAVTGCGSGPDRIDVSQETSDSNDELAQALGGCTGPPPDGPDPFQLLASPGVWLQLDGLSVAPGAGPEGPAQVEGIPRMIGGDPTAERTWQDAADSPLPLNTRYSENIQKALDSGAEVYIKTGYDGDPHMTFAAIAFLDGRFAFVGDCKFETYTLTFQSRYGDSAAEVARSIVGADSETTLSLLADPSESATEQVTILNPETVDAKALATLEVAGFSIPSLPESWTGAYTVCTRIDLGWSDCVDISSPELAAISVSAYVDPASPRVEAWLLDQEANLLKPIAMLGEMSVPSDSLGELLDDRTARLSLSLPSDRSVVEAAESPEQAGDGVVLSSEPSS